MSEAETPAAPRGRNWWRLTLVDLYLLRGLAGPLLLITGGTCAAMMLERALRLIHEMAASGAELGYFFPLLRQLLPYYINLALPAAFLIALIMLVARLDERLELEAMLASGFPLSRIAAPLIAAGALLAAISLVTGGLLEPHGRYGFRAMKVVAVNAGRIGNIQAGTFYEPGKQIALTLDERSGDEWRGVFIHQQVDAGRELILTAPTATVGFAGGNKDLLVRLGPGLYHLHRGGTQGARPVSLRFGSMDVRESLLLDEPLRAEGRKERELTLTELVQAHRFGCKGLTPSSIEAELYSRLARSVTIPLIPLLVLPLAFAAKRSRRGVGILMGGVILMSFHHGINFVRNLGARGMVDPQLSILTVTALFAAVVVGLFVASRRLPSHSPVAALSRPFRFLSNQVPKAAPRVIPTGAGTMAGYVAMQFTKGSLLATLAVVAILHLVDMLEKGHDFVERGLGMRGVGYYTLLRLPALVQQSIPVATLVGAMVAFSRLSTLREILPIRSAGISQYRLLRMTLPVASGLALSIFAMAEYAAPTSQVELSSWWHSTAPPDEREEPGRKWFRIGSDLVSAAGASSDGSRLNEVRIYRRGGDGLLSERIAARDAIAAGDEWLLRDVRRSRTSGRLATDSFAALPWRTALTSPDVKAFFAATPHVSSDAAVRSLEAAAPTSQGAAFFETRLNRKYAEPLAPLIMLLFAIPIAFAHVRTGPSWPQLLYAGGGGFFYVVSDGVLTVAAQVGAIPPPIGAWLAPLLFGLTGLTVLVYYER